MAVAKHRSFLNWSVAEAGPAFVSAGLLSSDELDKTLAAMQAASENPDVLVLAPRMSISLGPEVRPPKQRRHNGTSSVCDQTRG